MRFSEFLQIIVKFVAKKTWSKFLKEKIARMVLRKNTSFFVHYKNKQKKFECYKNLNSVPTIVFVNELRSFYVPSCENSSSKKKKNFIHHFQLIDQRLLMTQSESYFNPKKWCFVTCFPMYQRCPCGCSVEMERSQIELLPSHITCDCLFLNSNRGDDVFKKNCMFSLGNLYWKLQRKNREKTRLEPVWVFSSVFFYRAMWPKKIFSECEASVTNIFFTNISDHRISVQSIILNVRLGSP